MPKKLTGDALTKKDRADENRVELTLVVDGEGAGDVTKLTVGDRVYEKADIPFDTVIGILESVLGQLKDLRLASMLWSFLQEEE